MRLWAIQARVARKQESAWVETVGIPTFFLHPDVQLIENGQHACEIARKVVDPFRLLKMTIMAIAEDDGAIQPDTYAYYKEDEVEPSTP